MNLTIMSFNLRVNVPHDGDNAWPFRVDSAAQLIEETAAEVVCTQEGLYPMLLDLEKRLKNYAWVGHGRGGTQDEYCAVFYRLNVLQIVKSGHFSLSETPHQFGIKSWGAAFPRMCTWVQFQYVNDPEKQFIVLNTHLDNESEEAREQGICLVWEKIVSFRLLSGLPAIVTGDLNSTPESKVVRFLRGQDDLGSYRSDLMDAYRVISQEESTIGCSYHDFKGGTEGSLIDYIFTTPDMELLGTNIDRRKVNGKYVSDHYPVIAKLFM